MSNLDADDAALLDRVARAICWSFSEETDDCSSECFKAGRCMAEQVDASFIRDAKAAVRELASIKGCSE